MYDYLFEKQGEWGEKQKRDDRMFEQYAQKIGLDLEQFKKDRDSRSVKERIKSDQNDARRLGLGGTPSFFLNGNKIQNPRSFNEFKNLINAFLRNKKSDEQ